MDMKFNEKLPMLLGCLLALQAAQQEWLLIRITVLQETKPAGQIRCLGSYDIFEPGLETWGREKPDG